MGVFDGRGETLRSLHLLSTLLDLSYPLSAAAPLVASLAETRHQRAIWGAMNAKLFEGLSLSEAMTSLRSEAPFPTPLIALVEVGEMQGELAAALRAACESEPFDVFRAKELTASQPPPSLPHALLDAPIPGQVARLLKSAISLGAERLGMFCRASERALGPWSVARSPWAGSWTTTEEHDPLTEGASLSEEDEPEPEPWTRRSVPPPASPLGPRFEPAALSSETIVVGALRPEGWRALAWPASGAFPQMIRYCLFRAGLPYWRRQRAVGSMCFELESTRQRLPIEFAPCDEVPSLLIDLRGVYRLSCGAQSCLSDETSRIGPVMPMPIISSSRLPWISTVAPSWARVGCAPRSW